MECMLSRIVQAIFPFNIIPESQVITATLKPARIQSKEDRFGFFQGGWQDHCSTTFDLNASLKHRKNFKCNNIILLDIMKYLKCTYISVCVYVLKGKILGLLLSSYGIARVSISKGRMDIAMA